MEIIQKYFTELNDHQLEQLSMLGDLYKEWNAKINVISRKDIDMLYLHHVLHSLSIAKWLGALEHGTTFIDVGTGGGFPGVPLAIAYPECHFHLIDRIAKKIKVANEISTAIELKNVSFQHGDIGECHKRYDYAVSRAVMPLNKLVKLVRKNITTVKKNGNRYQPGLICLKGGDISEESRGIGESVLEYPISEIFDLPFFDTKKIVYVPIIK